MHGKSHDTESFLSSDLVKVDAHEIQPDEYEEVPELSDEAFERGRWLIAGTEVSSEEGKAAFRKALKRGRPKESAPKISTTIRLDADILAAFKATGRGWQTRLNKVLREWMKEHPVTF